MDLVHESFMKTQRNQQLLSSPSLRMPFTHQLHKYYWIEVELISVELMHIQLKVRSKRSSRVQNFTFFSIFCQIPLHWNPDFKYWRIQDPGSDALCSLLSPSLRQKNRQMTKNIQEKKKVLPYKCNVILCRTVYRYFLFSIILQTTPAVDSRKLCRFYNRSFIIFFSFAKYEIVHCLKQSKNKVIVC